MSVLTSLSMVNVNYEIPDDLHRRLKAAAAIRGMTLKALVIEMMESWLEDNE